MINKVLFIVHHDNYQGSSRSLMSLLEGLKRKDIQPVVVIPQESLFTEALAANEIPFEILPVSWWVSNKTLNLRKRFRILKSLIRSSIEIQQLIHKWKIDLVYTNSSVTPVGRMAAKSAGLPHVWHIRELGDLHFSFQYLFPKPLSEAYLRSSDAVICNATVVREHYFPRTSKNIHQIYNGVATMQQFNERLRRRNASLIDRMFTFVTLSAITPMKGQVTAIKAMAMLRDTGIKAKLIIAGDGRQDYLEKLNLLISDLELKEWIAFTGFVPDPFPLYYSSDCALICSEHEALSRVGLEAMSTALPLIGRNSGGIPEIIVDGETGFLYNNPKELCEAMINLVQKPELGRQMGLAGWQRAREMFNTETYAAKVYQVIQSVMRNK